MPLTLLAAQVPQAVDAEGGGGHAGDWIETRRKLLRALADVRPVPHDEVDTRPRQLLRDAHGFRAGHVALLAVPVQVRDQEMDALRALHQVPVVLQQVLRPKHRQGRVALPPVHHGGRVQKPDVQKGGRARARILLFLGGSGSCSCPCSYSRPSAVLALTTVEGHPHRGEQTPGRHEVSELDDVGTEFCLYVSHRVLEPGPAAVARVVVAHAAEDNLPSLRHRLARALPQEPGLAQEPPERVAHAHVGHGLFPQQPRRLQSSAAFTIFSVRSRLAAGITPIFMLFEQQVAISLFGVGALRVLWPRRRIRELYRVQVQRRTVFVSALSRT